MVFRVVKILEEFIKFPEGLSYPLMFTSFSLEFACFSPSLSITQGLLHTGKGATTEVRPQPFKIFLNMKWGAAQLPGQALDLPSSCRSLLSSRDYRCASQYWAFLVLF